MQHVVSTPFASPVMQPLGSPPFRAGTPPNLMADRIIRARRGNAPQIQFSDLTAEEIAQTIDYLVEANGLTDAFLLNAIDSRTRRLNLASSYHIRKYTLGTIPHQCPSLESIDLSDCRQVDNRMVYNLLTRCTRLRELALEGCVRVTDAAFFPSGGTPPVETSIVSPTSVPAIATVSTGQGLRGLRKLSLAGCRQITEDCLVKVAKRCIHLEEVNLSGCRASVTSKVLHAFFDLSLKFKRLKSIDISDCAVLASDESFVQYEYKLNISAKSTFLPIQILKMGSMPGCPPPKYTTRSVTAVSNMCGPNLVRLETAGNGSVKDEACFSLSETCKNLRNLNFTNSLVTRNGIDLLVSRIPQICVLDLSWCSRINGSAVECISKNLLNLREISLSHCLDFLSSATEKSVFGINPGHVVQLVRSCGQTLERLDLSGLPQLITSDVFAAFADFGEKLKSVSGSVAWGDFDAMQRWALRAVSVETLNLDLSRAVVSSESLTALSECFRGSTCFSNLDRLSLTATPKIPFNNQFLETLLTNRSHLEHLELSHCEGVSDDLFLGWVQGYSPEREAALLVEAMIENELQKGYISGGSSDLRGAATVRRCSDSETAAAPTVIFRGYNPRRTNRNFFLQSSASETDTMMAATLGFDLLKSGGSLVLSDAARAMDNLRSLVLIGVPKLTNASIDRLSLMSTYLERIELTDAGGSMSEECVEPLKRRCKLLRTVEITGPKIRVRVDSSRNFATKRRRKLTDSTPVVGQPKRRTLE